MNDLDLCLEVVSRSRQPLHYIRRWISRKPLEIEAWSIGPPIGNGTWAVEWSRDRWRHVTDDVTWPWKVKPVTPIRLERNISKTTWARDFKFGLQHGKCRAVAQIIFPESGRGLGHVTPTIFGIRSNISLKLLELETSNLVSGFDLPLLFDCRVLHTIAYTVRQYGRLS